MFTIPTQGKRAMLRFGVHVKGFQGTRIRIPRTLRIRGKSAASGCVYFDRNVPLLSDEEHNITLDFPLPISPEKLIVEFDGPAKPETLQTAYLWPLPEYEPVEKAFFDFLKWFLPRACKLKAGIYNIPGTPYRLLYYAGNIIDKDEGPIKTPARSDHWKNDLHASRRVFKNYSVPTNGAVLLHEFGHLVTGDREEELPDYYSVDLALNYGFSKTEVSFVHTKTIADTAGDQSPSQREANYERAVQMSQYIDQYELPDVDF